MDNDLIHELQNHRRGQHRKIGVPLDQLQELIGPVCIGVERIKFCLFPLNRRIQFLLLTLIPVRQQLEPLLRQTARGKGFIELLYQPVQFCGPFAVPVQLALQLLRGVVLPKLGGGANLLDKALFIGDRIGADGFDGIQQ